MLTHQTIEPTDQTIEPTDQTDRQRDLWLTDGQPTAIPAEARHCQQIRRYSELYDQTGKWLTDWQACSAVLGTDLICRQVAVMS